MAVVLFWLTADFVAATGIDPIHVTATWSYFEPGHYAAAGQVAGGQPNGAHPLLTADFSTAEAVEKMITCVAASLARLTGLPADNIFVHYRTAGSGTIFDVGTIVNW